MAFPCPVCNEKTKVVLSCWVNKRKVAERQRICKNKHITYTWEQVRPPTLQLRLDDLVKA